MASWLEDWIKDKKKRDEGAVQDKKTGKVNFKEASKASRVQYTLPNYEGQSKNKSYQWETDLLKPLSIRRYGRSYNDKFQNWARSLGMTDSQVDEYRRYLDFQEDRKQKYKLNSDGSPDNRKHIRPGQGAMLQSELIANIFKNVDNQTNRIIESNRELQAKREREVEKQKREQKKIKEKFSTGKTKENSFLGDLKQLLPIALKQSIAKKPSADDILNLAIDYVKEGKRPNDTTKEVARGITRAVNTAAFNIPREISKDDKVAKELFYNKRKGDGKVADFVYDALGYLVPGTAAYKGLNATKTGKALTEMGSKSIPKRLLSEAAKGGMIGAGLSGAEVGAREAINPEDYNWKDNASYIGLNTAIGAASDPAIYGAGKAIAKGFETASNKAMQRMIPDTNEAANKLSEILKSYNQEKTALPIKPKANAEQIMKAMPSATDIANPNYVPSLHPKQQTILNIPKVGRSLDEAIANPNKVTLTRNQGPIPKVKTLKSEFKKEFEDAVQQQYEYLKNSMGKGVEFGTTGQGVGNFREVNGSYRISNNPKWYQDFYKQYGRKPTNTELKELAVKHVMEGFDDEVGHIPPWQPKKVQEIDREIENVAEMIRQSPEQEAILKPILDGLQEDRTAILKEFGMDPNQKYQYMRQSSKQVKSLHENVQAMQSEVIPLREPSGNRQFKEMGKFESGYNKLKKLLGSADIKEKPITRQELLNSMKKNLGVTLRHGRLGNVPNEVQGYFKVEPEVIRTRNYGDIGVLSHEIGHHLDKQFKLTDPAFDSELLKLGRKTSASDYTTDQVRNEGLAEFIRLKLTDPQKAVTEAPKFSKHLDELLPPKVQKGLNKVQSDVDRWIEQGPELRLRGKVNRTGKENVTVGERIDKIYSQFIDKFDRLKKVEKAITGKLNDASQSLYKKARLSVGAPKKAEVILRDLKDVLKPIEKYGYNLKDVGDYATAVHAKELEALGIETGMTKEEIEKTIARFNTPEMKKIHQGLMKYNNMLLDRLKQGGILSEESVKAMKEKYPNYVPFYRFFEDDITSGLGGGKGFANLTNPVKRLKGSTKDVIDPLESMVKNTFAVINAVEKNKVGLELSRLADIEGAGRFIERLDGAQASKKEHIVTVFEKGKKVQYQLDKDLYEAIQQLDEDRANKVIQFLSVPASTLRAGATLTPEFMIRNPIRDQFQAFVVSNYGYNPIIDLPIGAWQVFKGKTGLGNSDVYKKWAEHGGGYGNYLSQDRNYLRETLRHLHNEGKMYQKGFLTIVNPKEWLRILQAMSEFTEEATKVGEFRRAMNKGATPEEAAYQSRDLMDFGRVGSDMRQWNRAVAFLNANIQGKDRIARAFKQNPVRTTIRALTGVTLPAIGAYMAMDKFANEKQKETYENTPKWLKDTFFIIPIPGTDELARIPKPFDLAPVFANPVEQVMDYIKKNDPDNWAEFVKRQTKLLADIPTMLTGLTPIIENITNYSFFTGGPIVPRRDQDLLPEDQYGPSTSLTARTVGKITGTSPYKVDNLIRGYGAGLGKYATSGADKLLEQLNVGKLPPQEAKKWSELPVVNAFTVDSTGGGQIMTDFYDTLDKLRKGENSANRNNTTFEKADEYKLLNKASRDISKIRKKYRNIQNDYSMTPREKRDALDELNRQMNQLAREALIEIGEKTK